jgi:hypothetical protein
VPARNAYLDESTIQNTANSQERRHTSEWSFVVDEDHKWTLRKGARSFVQAYSFGQKC